MIHSVYHSNDYQNESERPWLLSLILFLTIVPVSVFYNGGRIDIVMSDLLLILVVPKLRRPAEQTHALLLLCIGFSIYCILLALIATVTTSDLIRLGSCIKFVKPYIFLIAGLMVSQKIRFETLIKPFAFAITFLTWNLFVSTAATPGFPFIRWGGSLWGLNVYGFPNSSAVFLGALTPFLLVQVITKRGLQKGFFFISYFALSTLALLSYSRSTLICLLFANALTLWLILPSINSLKIFTFGGVGVLFTYFISSRYLPQSIINAAKRGWEGRWQRTFGQSDVSSGRFELWRDALSLLEDHPFVGYSFESFNDVSEFAHGGVHNQYIECLWKTGTIGLILFLTVWLIIFSRLWMQTKQSGVSRAEKLCRIAVFGSLSGIFISNLSQPNLTYSITGNFFCFLSGFLISRKQNADPATIIRERN